jgi:tyrosinase
METREMEQSRHARMRMPAAGEPMTSFAQMMLMLDPRLLERLRLPPWFPLLDERRDQATLTATQQERFLCAFGTLAGNGTLGGFVKIHGELHYQHGSERFLPWHRVFLRAFEQALQTVHPDVTIPYWDWADPKEETFPAWLAGYTPTVTMPSPLAPVAVTRSPGTAADLATLASNLPTILADATFAPFTASLESVHGGVHVWVGGTMSFIATAPADPIFWMHHANIDRLWWQWQQAHPGENPTLTGSGAQSPVMDPYPTTEPQTRDPHAMGFTYV